MSHPIPDRAIEFVYKRNQDEWRGFDTTRAGQLCSHKNINRGEFVCLATDGIMVIVEFLSGTIDYIHLENIEWPKLTGLGGPPKVRKPKPPTELELKLERLEKLQAALADL